VFNQQVQLMKTKLLEQGLPRRAEQFHRALQALGSPQITADESVPSMALDLI
jgi:elongation factor P hydroxylase